MRVLDIQVCSRYMEVQDALVEAEMIDSYTRFDFQAEVEHSHHQVHQVYLKKA